jgi:hypothetical protein
MFAGRFVLADVAPPPGSVPPSGADATLFVTVLIGFGVLVAIVAGASILVIRAVKKNGAPIDKS